MPEPIMLSNNVPLGKLERQVRAAFDRDGCAVVLGVKNAYRNLRRLRKRLTDAPPEHGWDTELLSPDEDPGQGRRARRAPRRQRLSALPVTYRAVL